MTYEATLSALADSTRRTIFERLRGGPLTVGEIAVDLPVSRAAVSQHLKVLKRAGLVSERPEGTKRIYSAEVQGLQPLRTYLEGYWSDVLGAYAKEAARRKKKLSSRRKR